MERGYYEVGLQSLKHIHVRPELLWSLLITDMAVRMPICVTIQYLTDYLYNFNNDFHNEITSVV